MSTYNDPETDNKTLKGSLTSPEYAFQQKLQELFESSDEQQNALKDLQEQQHFDELAWVGSVVINGVRIKKACEHSSCSHVRCERGLRVGGIEI
jgi:hypothetical protein